MARKGFPESYDVRALMRFLAELKAGAKEVHAPRYSHLTYDILPGEEIILRSPDIVIVEGVNVLQTPARRGRAEASVVVSDFFDFSIYVDAAEADLERWYVDRLLLLARRRCTTRARTSTSSRSTARTRRGISRGRCGRR